jgi:hypothetical protein
MYILILNQKAKSPKSNAYIDSDFGKILDKKIQFSPKFEGMKLLTIWF